jgi:hypothetical protein
MQRLKAAAAKGVSDADAKAKELAELRVTNARLRAELTQAADEIAKLKAKASRKTSCT